MRKLFLLCLVAVFLIAFTSCSDAGSTQNQNPTVKPSEDIDSSAVIEVNTGSLSKSLSDLKPGEKLFFRIGPTGKLNFSGVTLDSLFSVESKGTGRAKSLGESNNEQLSMVTDKDGSFGKAYIMLPQADGEVSLIGSDIGVSADDGIVELQKVGNELIEGPNYIEFQIFPTEKNYEESGDPEYSWPTYQNYIHLDFNSEQWSRYAGQKIAIMQCGIHKSIGSGGAGGKLTSGQLGIVENGNVVYSNEIRGLYDLSEKDSLHLYTFLRTPFYTGDDEYYRIYLLIPEVLSETPFNITDLPAVFKINPENGDSYLITISNIPKQVFTDLLVSIIGGHPRYTGEGGHANGTGVEKPVWVKQITKNQDGSYNAILYFEGIDDEFIQNCSWQTYVEPGSYFGSISLNRLNENWNPGDNINLTDFEEHNISIGGNSPLLYNIPLSITDGQNYKLTLSSSSGSVRFFRRTNHMQGNGILKKGSEPGSYSMEVFFEPGETGYITVYTLDGEATFSYKLSEN